MSPNDPPRAELALALPEPLRSLLAEISVLIAQISAHMSSVSPGEVQNVLAAHRQTFYRTMDAFGVGIIHFLAEDPPPDQIQAVQERITAQIREWSSTSPLLQHSLRKPRGQSSDPELVKALLRERPAGADIAALVFNDYYRYSVGGMAFRDRLEMLVQAVLQTVARCAAAGVESGASAQPACQRRRRNPVAGARRDVRRNSRSNLHRQQTSRPTRGQQPTERTAGETLLVRARGCAAVR